MPTYNNIAALNQQYYNECLLPHAEDIEELLIHAFRLRTDQDIEFDTDVLLRMDPKTQAEVDALLIRSAVMSPNEARVGWNLPPVKGGETPFLQQQMWAIDLLSERSPPDDFPMPELEEDNEINEGEESSGDDEPKDFTTSFPVLRLDERFANSLMHSIKHTFFGQ